MIDFNASNEVIVRLSQEKSAVVGSRSPEQQLAFLREHRFDILDRAANIMFPMIQKLIIGQSSSRGWSERLTDELSSICLSGNNVKKGNEARSGLLYWFCDYNPEKGTMTTYLSTAISNRAMDVIRSMRRRDALVISVEEDKTTSLDGQIDFSDSQEHSISPHEQAERIESANYALSFAQRCVKPSQWEILLERGEGKSMAEIAEEGGKSAATIKSANSRAVKAILRNPSFMKEVADGFSRT